MIHEISIAGVPPFWVQSEIDEHEMQAFVSWYELMREENGYVPLMNTAERARQRKDFIDKLRQQHPNSRLYANTGIQYWLKENERSARWLHKKLSQLEETQYTTLLEWVNGEAKPRRQSQENLQKIIGPFR